MNNPSPLIPQGTSPDRDKSGFFIKFLMIVAFHVVVIGGLLLQGCKGTKDKSNDLTDTLVTTNTTPDSISSLPPLNPSNPPTPPGGFGGSPGPNNFGASGAPGTPQGSNLAGPGPIGGIVTPPPPPPPPQAPETKEYVIARGDLLSTIAKKNGVTLKALMDANPGVDAKKLKVGAKLALPVSASTSSGTATGMDTGAGDTGTYTVKAGDNLTRIAKANATTVKKLQELNNLKTTSIKVGQKLKVPAKASEAAAPAAASLAPAPAPMQFSTAPAPAPTTPGAPAAPAPMTR